VLRLSARQSWITIHIYVRRIEHPVCELGLFKFSVHKPKKVDVRELHLNLRLHWPPMHLARVLSPSKGRRPCHPYAWPPMDNTSRSQNVLPKKTDL